MKISHASTSCLLAAALLAPRAAAQSMPVAVSASGGGYDVWLVDESTGATSLSLPGIQFLSLELCGYPEKDALRLDVPTDRGAFEPVDGIRLPGGGALHRVDAEPPSGTAERPLLLMALATEKAQGSQWVHGALAGPLEAVVHPDAAGQFADGQRVGLQSELGQLTVRLKFDKRQRRDVVLVPKGGWLGEGRCANALVRARETDAGGCAVYHDTPVRLVAVVS